MQQMRRIDFYGRPISFYFDDFTYKTYLGMFLSMTLIVLVVIVSVVDLINLWNGDLDSIIWMSKPYSSATVGSHDLMEGVTLGVAIEDTLIEKNIYLEYYFAGKDNSTIVNMFNCSSTVYARLMKNDLDRIPPNMNIYCINLPSSDFIQGIVPRIKVMQCERWECLQNKKLQDRLNDFHVWSFSSMDMNDYTTPDSYRSPTFYVKKVTASRSIRQELSVVLSEVELLESKGIILSETLSYRSFVFNYADSSIREVYPSAEIFRINLELNFYTKIYIKKEYRNLMSLVSYLGGLFKGFSTFFMIIVYPFREIWFYKKLVDSVFDICSDKDQLQQFVDNIIKPEKTTKEESEINPNGCSTKVLKSNIGSVKKRVVCSADPKIHPDSPFAKHATKSKRMGLLGQISTTKGFRNEDKRNVELEMSELCFSSERDLNKGFTEENEISCDLEESDDLRINKLGKETFPSPSFLSNLNVKTESKESPLPRAPNSGGKSPPVLNSPTSSLPSQIVSRLSRIQENTRTLHSISANLSLRFSFWDSLIVWLPDCLISTPRTRLFKQVVML